MPFDDQPTEELGQDATARIAVAGTPFLTAGSRLRDGRYVLERSLGHGGMAAVWLARDERLDRLVAVKIVSDTLAGDGDYLARFHREAQVAASLSHPNLVNVYDFEAAERPYLVMEYVPGGDLAARIADDDRPDPERLAAELLAALSHIHAAGVLHRDVKPQNVLIDAGGSARLADFGIAQPRDATSLTRTGQVLGTATYLAPEVLRAEGTSERSDLYSLGVVLAEVIEGQPASAPLRSLIDRLRDVNPAARPASAADGLRELAAARTPAGEPTRPLAVPPPPLEPPAPETPFEPGAPFEPPEPEGRGSMLDSRHKAIGALALAAVAVALIVGLALGGGDEAPSGSGGERNAGAGQGSRDQGGDEGTAPPPAEEPATPAEASGAELNDQGYALIQEGRYDEAIPVLQQAVSALEATSEDITYAYALFNLGQALRLGGRPEEAIPILEQRLEIPNQTDVVQRELDAARAAAGEGDVDSSGPGSGEEPPGNAFGHEKNGKDDDD